MLRPCQNGTISLLCFLTSLSLHNAYGVLYILVFAPKMQCALVHFPTYTTELVNMLPLCFYHFLLLSHHSAWQCNICKWNELTFQPLKWSSQYKKTTWWIQEWDSTGQQPINLRKERGKKQKWSTSKGENVKTMRNTINEDKRQNGPSILIYYKTKLGTYFFLLSDI